MQCCRSQNGAESGAGAMGLSLRRFFAPLFLYLLYWAITANIAQAQTPQRTLDSYFDQVTSIQSRFTQLVFDTDRVLKDKSSGTLTVQRPDKFHLEYTHPYRQLYIADGKKLWMYDEDLEQVTVKPQDNLLSNTPAMVLINPEALDKHYSVEAQGEKNDLTWFKLTPKNEEGSFEQIDLGFAENLLKVMELHDSFGQITRLEFTDLHYNGEIKAGQFKFTPPPGVDVISQ